MQQELDLVGRHIARGCSIHWRFARDMSADPNENTDWVTSLRMEPFQISESEINSLSQTRGKKLIRLISLAQVIWADQGMGVISRLARGHSAPTGAVRGGWGGGEGLDLRGPWDEASVLHRNPTQCLWLITSGWRRPLLPLWNNGLLNPLVGLGLSSSTLGTNSVDLLV